MSKSGKPSEVIGTSGSSENLIVGGVAVVYRDEYDDLCEVAADMAKALQPFVSARNYSCTCPEDGHYSCPWCEAAHALKGYEDADR